MLINNLGYIFVGLQHKKCVSHILLLVFSTSTRNWNPCLNLWYVKWNERNVSEGKKSFSYLSIFQVCLFEFLSCNWPNDHFGFHQTMAVMRLSRRGCATTLECLWSTWNTLSFDIYYLCLLKFLWKKSQKRKRSKKPKSVLTLKVVNFIKN